MRIPREPMDKAGSYAVRDFARYIDGLKGYLRECGWDFRCICISGIEKLGAL